MQVELACVGIVVVPPSQPCNGRELVVEWGRGGYLYSLRRVISICR